MDDITVLVHCTLLFTVGTDNYLFVYVLNIESMDII